MRILLRLVFALCVVGFVGLGCGDSGSGDEENEDGTAGTEGGGGDGGNDGDAGPGGGADGSDAAAGGGAGGGSGGGDAAAGGGDVPLMLTVKAGDEEWAVMQCPQNDFNKSGIEATYSVNCGSLAAINVTCHQTYDGNQGSDGYVKLYILGNDDGGATEYEGTTERWEGVELGDYRAHVTAGNRFRTEVTTARIEGGYNDMQGIGINNLTTTPDSFLEIESWDANARRVSGSMSISLTSPESRDEFMFPQDVPIVFEIEGTFDFEYPACDM